MKNEAEDLYLLLLGNPNNTFRDILYLKDYKDQYYLNLRSLFDLRQEIYQEMSNKELIKNDCEESIAERTKLEDKDLLRKQ